jgi:hypothetical protein
MSFEDGWAAINLEKPARIPHFEPSAADYHWDLVKTVTGIDVDCDSPQQVRSRASREFVKAWNYDLLFGIAVGHDVLGCKALAAAHRARATRTNPPAQAS